MQLMKRWIWQFSLAITLGLVAAPLSVVQTQSGLRLVSGVARAATIPGSGGGGGCTPPETVQPDGTCKNTPTSTNNPLKPDDCVKIALPILSTSGNCINNKDRGGAIVNYLVEFLRLMGGLAGVFVFLMLVIAGVQFLTSAGDPGRVKSARDRIVRSLMALAIYLTMFAALNFLVPGGLF